MNKKVNLSKHRQSSRIPEDSHFFEKIVPALLIIMAAVTVGLILFAAGILLGIISF